LRIALFVPCFVNHALPQVGRATVRLLEALGHQVVVPRNQTCCGQPAFNTGLPQEAAAVGKTLVERFQGEEVIVAPSGSCVAMVRRELPRLLPELAPLCNRFRELTEFLGKDPGVKDFPFAPFRGRAALHVGCHLLRGLGVEREPLELLRSVEGLQVVPLEADRYCCGFGGTFSVKAPRLSTAIGETRLAQALRLDLDWIVTTDPSCMLHMEGILARKRARTRVLHIAQVLAPKEEER